MASAALLVKFLNDWEEKKPPNARIVSKSPFPLLTHSFRQPVDPLPVCVSLIPDICVGQIWGGVEPFLEEVALHCYHQVNLEQSHGHHSGSHGHLEQGAVTLCPGA